MEKKYELVRVKETKEAVKDFKLFVLEGIKGSPAYQPGQYLTFVHHAGGEEIRRSYSLCSTPALHEPLTIGVKRIENGLFSRYLTEEVTAGDTLHVAGVGGFFVLPQNVETAKAILFFAAGSGIVPIFSLLKTVLIQHSFISVILIYSNHAPEQTIFLDELKEWQKNFFHRFSIEFIFSNHPDLYHAHLHRDLIFSFLKKHAVQKEKTFFYCCGPESYMRLCTYVLQEAHVPAAHIKKENFVIHRNVARNIVPPDVNPHLITVQLKDRTLTLPVQYPTTILKALKDRGIPVPYSCETGRCGSCAAQCLQGTVWMWNNEVLTSAELKDGLVLTCTGYPVGGDVLLQW